MEHLKEVEIILFAAKRLEQEGFSRTSSIFMYMLNLIIELYIANRQKDMFNG